MLFLGLGVPKKEGSEQGKERGTYDQLGESPPLLGSMTLLTSPFALLAAESEMRNAEASTISPLPMWLVHGRLSWSLLLQGFHVGTQCLPVREGSGGGGRCSLTWLWFLGRRQQQESLS